MIGDRPSLGFEEELEKFDPEAWQSEPESKPKPNPPKTRVEAAARASGFRSREANPANRTQKTHRRHRTGRNTQFNIKADPAVIARFIAVADAQGWVFGETLEVAVELLEQSPSTDKKTQR